MESIPLLSNSGWMHTIGYLTRIPGPGGRGEDRAVIVRLSAEGAVVQDADDLGRLHVQTDLDADGLRTALRTTGTGELVDGDTAMLDVAVLRSRAVLLATRPDWAERWADMIAYAERSGWLHEDGKCVQVHVER
jgi:hypothetical protein